MRIYSLYWVLAAPRSTTSSYLDCACIPSHLLAEPGVRPRALRPVARRQSSVCAHRPPTLPPLSQTRLGPRHLDLQVSGLPPAAHYPNAQHRLNSLTSGPLTTHNCQTRTSSHPADACQSSHPTHPVSIARLSRLAHSRGARGYWPKVDEATEAAGARSGSHGCQCKFSPRLNVPV
jgi:hypothetical protein